ELARLDVEVDVLQNRTLVAAVVEAHVARLDAPEERTRVAGRHSLEGFAEDRQEPLPQRNDGEEGTDRERHAHDGRSGRAKRDAQRAMSRVSAPATRTLSMPCTIWNTSDAISPVFS